MAGTTSVEERVERLKGLLTGQSSSTRAVRALSPGDGYANLLLGAALHGADGRRQGRTLTDLEGLLVDALGTIMEDAELKEWGRAYRETVQGSPMTLIVPKVIADLPAGTGYSVADLERVLPQLSAEVAKAPNVNLLSLEDLAAGRQVEDQEFLDGMQACGFAVTGVARYPDAGPGEGEEAPASWRVRLQMEKFYVERAVGDQGGGRDEIYFTAASSAGGGGGQTFTSEEFGAVKKGQTRTFNANRKVFLDEDAGPTGLAVSSIQVWEADQSSSRWYDALQKSLNRAVEEIDSLLNNPVGAILDPIPLPLTIAYEVAKVFIALMDTLRNNDDLSCSRTFVLTRDDMAILGHQGSAEWNFNGDGWHKLTVRYTGERPVYPTGAIEIISRPQGATPGDAGEWDAPIPLGWKTSATPALAVYHGALHTLFPRAGDNQLLWSRYDGTAWSTPQPIGSAYTGQPPALAVHDDCLHALYTGGDHNVYHAWCYDTRWSPIRPIPDWSSPLGPALAELDGTLWAAATGGNVVHYADYVSGTTWNPAQPVPTSGTTAHSAPALGLADGEWITINHRTDNSGICTRLWKKDLARWSSVGDIAGVSTHHAPTVHEADHCGWLAYRDTSGRARLAWRTTALWEPLPEPIARGTWTCAPLAAPSLTTHNNRLYAIYHA
ncbi:hypothetical protein ACFWIB_38470 [Streptomyces sp. NPDC127051]|uniref:hypothetical protein n=1 Tax=Streptomyces sp. NPDC127051 TaxID=3347119 RepID=UPI0036599A58